MSKQNMLKRKIEGDNRTHDSDNETMVNTNNKHTWIDEDEPPINEDQT